MAYNNAAKNTNLPDQGAQYTERSENERARLVDSETGEVRPTENSENQRIETVDYSAPQNGGN